MKWYPYGHDFGNSEIGGVTVIDGKNESLSIPTAFAKADINAMRNLGVKMDQSNMHIIQFYGEALAYAVGELALQQAVDVYHGRGDIQRYSSKYSLRALLAVAAALIPDCQQKPTSRTQRSAAISKQHWMAHMSFRQITVGLCAV
jgi:hypothetical protein